MKICVDVQSAIAQRAGIGRYTRILVEQLSTAGLEVLSVTYDSQRMFPAVAAKKTG